MYSFKKNKSFLPLVIIPLLLLVNNCSDRSEYGEASDYVKLGAAATTGACTNGEDTTAPTISSVSPIDNSTYYISVATTVAVTFSEKMATGSVTTNTSDTTCSGSFQLSSDNFTSCIKMSAAPVASDNETIFTITPASSLSAATTYKTKITTSVKDISCNTLGSANTTDNGFITSPSAGSGTIKGSVINYSGSSALSGVNVSYALSEKTLEEAATTDNSGDFDKSSLAAGTYTLTYEKGGYEDETQSATLATDSQTLTVSTMKMCSTSSSATATISGKITDAVNGTGVSNVSISIRRGMNTTSGTVYATAATTDSNGDYSFSNVARGWYTLQTSVDGYINSSFEVVSCGDVSGQDSSISKTLASGVMRIILSWPTGSTAVDLDSHLKVPDNASSNKHIYYPTVNKTFYYATNTNTCSSCSSSQLSDNVTLDRDEQTAAGTETVSITAVRSGDYSYSVHDYTNGKTNNDANSTNLASSGASVTIYYNNTVTIFNPPNTAGTHWTVFTFTTGGGIVEVGTMKHTNSEADVY